MTYRGRLWLLLAVSYLAALETVHILWTGRATATLDSGLKTLISPTLEVLALVAFERVIGRRPSRADNLARFFANWLVLTGALWIAHLGVEILLVRRIDWTDAALFLLLATPVAQAAELTVPTRWATLLLQRLRWLSRSPFNHVIVWLDGVILSAGWFLADHPLVGMAGTGILQRRWMGLKLMSAAVACAWLSLRLQHSRSSAQERRTLLTAALALAGLAIGGVSPWISGLTTRVPGYLPTLVVRILVFGGGSAFLLAVVLRVRAAIASRSTDAASMFGAGAVALLVAALALAMNGFLAAQPVYPWGAAAITSASMAATMFLVGSVGARLPTGDIP